MTLDFLQAMILGVVQGATEFLPVSSSGHLVVLPWALGWAAPSLAFDTILHLGTLLAVLLYFANDIVAVVTAWAASVWQRRLVSDESRIGWLLIIATVPGILAGLLLDKWFEEAFSNPALVGWFWMATAAILSVAELSRHGVITSPRLGTARALAIGCAQALAILPGISRSGATIGIGMMVGLKREEAARFSFLLAVPIILGAAGSQLLKLRSACWQSEGAAVMLIGFAVAAVTGYICIALLLRYLRRRPLYPFAAYCLVIGVATVLLAPTAP